MATFRKGQDEYTNDSEVFILLHMCPAILLQKKKIVYVIDPDVAIGEALSALLGTYDMQVRFFTGANQFLDAYTANESESGCLLVETHLADSSGLSLLKELRKQGSTLPVILLANTANPNFRHEAFKAGAIDVIEKPLVNSSLLARLEQVFSK